MSTICHAFVQNAWRKDICSNCFRVRDEHSASEIDNSVKYNINETSGGGAGSNGVNIPSIVPRSSINNNKKYGNEANASVVGGGSENGGACQNFSQRPNRFLAATANLPVANNNSNNNNAISSSSSSGFGQQGSSYSMPRISNGVPTVSNGKFSGTNNYNNNTSSNSSAATTTTTKGHQIHSQSGSKSNINSGGGGYNHNHNEYNNDSSTLSETNWKTRNAEGTLTKTPTPSHLQGKGLMTNQHPSKSDNAGVILNHNNNDNSNKQPMTMTSSAAGVVSHLSSTAATIGRSASSSYIASKNIFNNAHIHKSISSSAVCITSYSTTAAPSTAITTTCSSINNNCSGNATGLLATGCMNGNAASALASVSGSTGLSHPQSTTSIKRGNIVASSSSPVLAPSSSSSSSSSSSLSLQSQNAGSASGDGTVVDPINGCTGAGYHKRNLEDCDKNGLIGDSATLRETPEGVVSSSNNSFCTSVSKGVIVITPQQSGMNRGRAIKPVMEVTSGDSVLDRRKVGFSGVNSNNAAQNWSSGQVMSSNGTVGKPTAAPRTSASKGILRDKNGRRKREKNVRFPDEVVSVIGYGGGPSGISDDEDDTPQDPLDSASVNEVMEKNSTTLEEKELHRMTQKNTNFNSIKTNLLGTTCIEIGPIVGCTGGKSMAGSSKPLVSIGTFETRKEPLRIQKKISEDSADDELNEKTVEKHRKFTPRMSNISNGGKPPLPTSQAPTKSTSMPSTNNTSQSSVNKVAAEIAKQQQTTVSSLLSSRSVISNNNKTASSSTSSPTTINSISSNCSKAATTISSSKTSSSISTKNVATVSALSSSSSDNNGSGSPKGTTMTIEINPEKASSTCTTTTTKVLQSSKESSIATTMSSSTSSSPSTEIVTSNKACSSSSNSSNTATTTANNTTTTTTKCNKWGNANMTLFNAAEGPSVRNKPVLKRIQQKNASESMVETNKSSSSTTTSNDMVDISGRSNSNLIILTNGDKSKASVGNNNSIASKRSSFLRDIIIDSSSSSAAGDDELNRNNGTSASSVQVICKSINGTTTSSSASHEQDSLMIKSELKVDLKPSVNNGKLSHPPFGECLSNRSNGTDDSSEFDDSLEDSGLDIKKCSEISSDEKSGSGSDSGNENDYSDRDRVNIIPTAGPKSGLFISVDEVEGTNKKPEKLSPDSVLFSSASEMSASGSSESIPEALDTVSNASSSQKSSTCTSSPSPSAGNDSVAVVGNGQGVGTTNTVKRTAPRPPSSEPPTKSSSNGLYANSQASVVTVEGIYDDVSFYKNPMHFPQNKVDNKSSPFEEEGEEEEEEDEEENIYDDCTAVPAVPSKGKAGGKSAVGSYSFQNGSHNTLDSDEEIEKVVHRRSDGIEFIGIRKIDSESFLRERSPTPERSPDGKRERSSSASPKTRRKVNQFFSTIGKRAGAAFSQHVHAYKNKSNPVIEIDSGIEKSPSGSSSAYKRSMSTDEVSMTRTQEIYATLTPTSLKFKGLGPVLHKLSRIDLNMGDKDRGMDDDDSKEKNFKKHKISSSIKKFLRFGSKDGNGSESSGNKYDFGNCQTKTETNGSSQMITTLISEEGMTDPSCSRTPTPTKAVPTNQIKISDKKPYGTVAARPPPPPPRVHSLDLLTRVGVAPHGTVRPARPPPPARQNRVAPSFTAVFNNPNADTTGVNEASTTTLPSAQNNNLEQPDPNNPPSKPKRKASMNLDCVTNGISRDLEKTYTHITTLNMETLKLIASQTPMKIRRSSNLRRRSNNSPLKWSNFQILESCQPLSQGHGFAFYSALLDDESCVLLIQESATAPNFSAPFEFPCVETSVTFEDCIPDAFVTWKASDYVTNGSSVKVFVSVMPKYNLYSVESYMRHSQVPLLHKYFALLQAMTYWDKDDMSDLLVLVQSVEESSESLFMTSPSPTAYQPSSSPSSVLVYVHPIPHLTTSSRSKTQLCADFENAMKQLLLSSGSDGATPLLGHNDRQVLMKRLYDKKGKTIQDQFRLFLQVKLFAPKRDSEELERIKKLRSERAIQQWLDRERAMCMKEAVEQTLQRSVESSISPYKRSYLEFLLTPENSAKAVLEMLIDLLE